LRGIADGDIEVSETESGVAAASTALGTADVGDGAPAEAEGTSRRPADSVSVVRAAPSARVVQRARLTPAMLAAVPVSYRHAALIPDQNPASDQPRRSSSERSER